MEISDELHTPSALTLRKETPVFINRILGVSQNRYRCSGDESNVVK
jgi:hypothetical protein